MGNWQVTGRVKTGFAALAGAVVVSLVGPGVAEAAAAGDDSSTPKDPSGQAASGVQDKQGNEAGNPKSADSPAQQPQSAPPQSSAPPENAPPQSSVPPLSEPQQSSAPQQSEPPPDAGHAAAPGGGQVATPPLSPQHRSSTSRPAPGSAPPAQNGRHHRAEASGAPPAAEAGRSSAGGAALEQAQAGMPQTSPPPLADLTKLVYTFLPTRTVLDPARSEADALALRDTLVQYWLSQLEQIKKGAADPDAAAEAFVRDEWLRFRADPARYVGELRDKMAITAAASASAEADEAAVTVGDRVAARAQRADDAQQVIRNTEAGGKVWGTEITLDTPGARSDIFARLPNGQAFIEVKNAVSGVSAAQSAADDPVGSGAIPARGR